MGQHWCAADQVASSLVADKFQLLLLSMGSHVRQPEPHKGIKAALDDMGSALQAEVGPRLQTQTSTIDISHMPSPDVMAPQQSTDAEIHESIGAHQPAAAYASSDDKHRQGEARQLVYCPHLCLAKAFWCVSNGD